MRKQILIKYSQGDASERELEQIALWLKQSEANRAYFNQLMDHLALTRIAEASTHENDMPKGIEIIERTMQPRNKENLKLHRQLIFFRSIAAILLLALSIGIGAYYKYIKSSNNMLTQVFTDIPKDYLHTIYTNKGVKSQVVLPDSSVVILNSDSKLVFPDKFSDNKREVFLSGEAYFTVVPNAKRPMIVATNRNFIVQVLGTEFNIRTYDDDNKASATLYKGSIKLLVTDKISQKIEEHTMAPNQTFVLQDDIQHPILAKPDIQKVKAWTEGTLVFDQTPIEEVIKELQRWHGSKFVVKDNELYSRNFTATFQEESLVQIMEVLNYCSGIKYSIDNNIVTLFL